MSEIQIYLPPTKPNPENPFARDALNRRPLAQTLTQVITKMQQGGVIAIDADWGDGKSWFGRNWYAMLKNELGYKTAFIDTFEGDHVDDPFSLIAAHFLEMIKEDAKTTEDLKSNFVKVGKLVCSGFAKGVVNAAVRYTIGEDAGKAISDSVTEAVGDAAGDVTEALVKAEIEGFSESQDNIKQLREALRNMPKPEQKPAVVFVDELDRCRPDFAVKTLERIKHFFDVPGVVFVLLINRKALVAAVRGLYGLGNEAERYLSKFIHFSVQLPKKNAFSYGASDSLKRVCRRMLDQYGFQNQDDDSQKFQKVFCTTASVLGMTFRDVERAVILYSFARDSGIDSSLLAWAIAVKLHAPDAFSQILKGIGGEEEIRALMNKVQGRIEEKIFMNSMISVHTNAYGNTDDLDPTAQAWLAPGQRPAHFLKQIYSAVDVSIE